MLKAVILLFIFFFSYHGSVFAARQISISSDKSSISLDNEMIISASTSGFTNGETIYLKGAFYKDGSSNYFGYTKFNNSWIKNSATSKSQREVKIGVWDNFLAVKLDYDDSGYTGLGDYKFKLGFYYLTSSGNISSVNWSTNSIDISIKSEPSPTPKPETSSVSTESVSEELTTTTPSPVSSQYTTGSKTNIISPKSVKITNVKKEASQYAKIKPIEEAEVDEKSNEAQVLGVTKESILPKVYLAFGTFILSVAVFMLFKREWKGR